MSGEVKGVDALVGDLSESSPEFDDADDELLGNMSGALYDSIFVVDMSSIGAEILCLIVPEGKECFAVKLLFGISDMLPGAFALFLVVKALERDIFAEYGRKLTSATEKVNSDSLLPSTNDVVGCLANWWGQIIRLVIGTGKLGAGAEVACVGLADAQECAAPVNMAFFVVWEGPDMYVLSTRCCVQVTVEGDVRLYKNGRSRW